MSYESTSEPIKLGYIMDFKLPPGYPKVQFDDLAQSFQLVFRKGREQGLIDRDVAIVYR